MFLDSDFNSNGFTPENFSGEDYLNHPGFIGITWSKKKAEAEREDSARNTLRDQCNLGNIPGKDCKALDDAFWCLDDKEQYWLGASTGSKGARRVRNRNLKVVREFQSEVEDAQNLRDCDGATSAIDQSQQQVVDIQKELDTLQQETEQKTKDVLNQAELMILQNQQEAEKNRQNLLLYGGIGAAVLIGLYLIK